jgi:glycosyltransferase involved in cell wall biosynthesis
MKIIHVLLGKANPDSMNGVNKVVHYLATEQHRMGYDVEVWGITFSKNPPVHNHEYNLRIFRDSKLRFYLSSELKEALKNLTPDTWVQLHSVFIPEFFTIAILLRKVGVRYGFTPHGGYSIGALRRRWLIKQIFLFLFESYVLRNAVLIHAVGETETVQILKIVKHNNVVLVPNGQDLLSLDFNKKIMQAERPIFGFCGRLDAVHKGLDLMIEGFNIYKKEGGKGELWLIGDGTDREKLLSMARAFGIQQSVKCFGAKFVEEKFQIIDNFDSFIHASRWDGIPTSCLEAAALSKPLLISRETNLASFVKSYSAGWVLIENTPEQISEEMFRVEREFSGSHLGEYGQRARRMIEAEFTWPNIAKKLVRAYECAIA